MGIDERRKYPRIRLIAKVAHIRGNQFHYFYSRDLSVGGIFLESDHPYPAGTTLELELVLPEIADKLRLRGRVIRVEPPESRHMGKVPGMGIEFLDMDTETQALLADFIARELARQ